MLSESPLSFDWANKNAVTEAPVHIGVELECSRILLCASSMAVCLRIGPVELLSLDVAFEATVVNTEDTMLRHRFWEHVEYSEDIIQNRRYDCSAVE